MTIEQMKAAILDAYPGWFYRVQKMHDKQIYAMYMRLLDAKKL